MTRHAFAFAAALLALGGCAAMTFAQEPRVVPKFGLFETSLTCDDRRVNPFVDAPMTVEFTSPSGKKIPVLGFYYGGNEWRVRFVPREEGLWQYTCALPCRAGGHAGRGSFECKGISGRGFLRISKKNNFRLEFEDGTPFYPIGIQTCNFLKPDFDGPNADGSWRNASAEEWMNAFDGAVNLVRTQLGQGVRDGCAFDLIPAGDKKAGIAPGPVDRFNTDLAAKLDDVFRGQRARGVAQILILYQDMSLWGDPASPGGPCAFGTGHDQVNYKNVNAPNMPDQERYIRYAVARFGCFVDAWELFNEDSYAPNNYLAHLAKVVRDADPYAHIVTTNYARPTEPWCEVVTWHEYMGMPANDVDAYLAGQISLYKSYGKPVVNTEFGNQGKLSNFDPVKWRIAVWTAFMNESSLLFWGMSGRKTVATGVNKGGNANAYIGADSRQHFRVLNAFNRDMPADMKPAPIGWHGHDAIRAYALSNRQVTAVYVHHFADHAKEYQLPHKLHVMTGPGRFRVKWIDPEDGRETLAYEASTISDYVQITLPPIKIDAACRIDRIGDAKP